MASGCILQLSPGKSHGSTSVFGFTFYFPSVSVDPAGWMCHMHHRKTRELPGKQTENGRRGGTSVPAEVRLCLYHITEKHGSLGSKGRGQWFSRRNGSISRWICGTRGPIEARAGREGKEEPTPITCSLVHGFLLRSCTFGFSSPKTSRDFGM